MEDVGLDFTTQGVVAARQLDSACGASQTELEELVLVRVVPVTPPG